MATQNTSTGLVKDVQAYLAQKTLPIAQRELVAYQFGDKLKLPQHMGTTYTATRFSRVNLPFAPLSEGVPSVGEIMPISQSSGTALQWGDSIYITDVAQLTIKHDLFQKAVEMVGIQVAETLERNTFGAPGLLNYGLMTGTNINFANSRAARANILNTDVMTPHEINKAVGALITVGAPRFGGESSPNIRLSADKLKGVKNPHYVALIHPLVAQDLRENTTISTAWSYSDINRLYTYEVGEWGGVRFCMSNMVPTLTGFATLVFTPSNTGGVLNTTNPYYIVVTGGPATTSIESSVYQVSAPVSIAAGTTGSISFTTPNIPGFVFNAYIGTVVTPGFVALSAAGPSTGPLAGMAVQLPPNTSVVLTGGGLAQVPPAAPATGVTVFPTFVLAKGAYGQVELDNIKFEYLKNADKSDPHNQLRVVSWKVFYGTMILNNAFFMRIESGSAFSNPTTVPYAGSIPNYNNLTMTGNFGAGNTVGF